jgi:N-acetyl-gamma-glutamyl-phosphate reductase
MKGNPLSVSVVGASGYSGGEAVRWLLRHPRARIAALFGSGRGEKEIPFSRLHPRERGLCDLPVRTADPEAIVASGAALVLFATPHEASAELAPVLLEANLRVIDLSGAFRLRDASAYPRVYGFEHPRPDLLEEAVYGIPEISAEAIREARLVANPGCYATSVVLPLFPLLHAGLVDRSEAIVADSISGVSGAGRAPSPTTHFCEVSAKAYAPLAHRHLPEIEQALGSPVAFVPHLAPYARGILTTLHFRMTGGAAASDLRAALARAFDARPLVRLLPEGDLPSVGAVEGTNFCDVALACDDARRRAVLLCALDNLGKGAAGQAIQNLNLMAGFEEAEGLR